MTQKLVFFHPAVEYDLADIYEHYGKFDPVLPDRFEVRLTEQVERLGVLPESGAVLFENYRRVLIKRFPYMAVYRVGDERVDVLLVVGARRDPEWIEATVSDRADG